MWFPVHFVDVMLRTRNVNNERIKRDIDKIVMEVIKQDWSSLLKLELQVDLVEYLEVYLNEFAESETSLDTVEVICDHRNNTREDCADGKVNLTVRYQQQNCLNVTDLTYEIKC